MIVEAKHTKVTKPRETKMVSTKKSVYGPHVPKPCSAQMLRALLLAWDIPGPFVKYIYWLNEEKPQRNGTWQLYFHCSCTDAEQKGQKENNRIISSPEKSQGNLALQVDFLTLPTPAKTTKGINSFLWKRTDLPWWQVAGTLVFCSSCKNISNYY